MAPIIESCTKDSISLGKGWIFTKAVSHDSNQLIAHYLAFRVTDDSAPFTLKLHLVRRSNVVESIRKTRENVFQNKNFVVVISECLLKTRKSGTQYFKQVQRVTHLLQKVGKM